MTESAEREKSAKSGKRGKTAETLPPALVALARGASYVEEGGEARRVSREEAARLLRGRRALLLCHAPFTARRLGAQIDKRARGAMDLMELFAFVYPARDSIPSPQGLGAALGLETPAAEEEMAALLHRAARHMLDALRDPDYPRASWAASCAREMKRLGWNWGGHVAAACEGHGGGEGERESASKVLSFLSEWEEKPPFGASSKEEALREGEAAASLKGLLAPLSLREGQEDYAETVARIFQESEGGSLPHAVLAEAGTGIGKTLAYMAPARLWAARAKKPVWIATYTKALQKQIDGEAERIYPDAAERKRRIVLRKGRDNYLCLLKWEEREAQAPPDEKIFLILARRWMAESRDGDIRGGDFPSWLPDLLGRAGAEESLTDRRGECLKSACAHYRKCFIERQRVLSRRADLVVTNHALVMSRAAQENLSGEAQERRPEAERYIFDEGHHLFEAADSAFTTELTNSALRELRLWLEGAGAASRSSMGGLRRRIGAEGRDDEILMGHLEAALINARGLPEAGAMRRLAQKAPRGAAELFFAALYKQVARNQSDNPFYSLEALAYPPDEEVRETAASLAALLDSLAQSLRQMMIRMDALLSDDGGEGRKDDGLLTAAFYGLSRHLRQIAAERDMLESVKEGLEEMPEHVIDRFVISRGGSGGGAPVDLDCGMMRHPLDPTQIFAQSVMAPSEGVLVTSASLRDAALFEENFEEHFSDPPDEETPNHAARHGGWEAAFMRTGIRYLPDPPDRIFTPSPFDYARQARILLVGDVPPYDEERRARAYRDLFMASGGGALGLFTAIRRLRSIYARIAPSLAEAGLFLLAQHIDAMPTSALVEMFRHDKNSCLLGTDAVRDGIDVPGAALRLLVFDKTPWPRPDIPHRARMAHFGGQSYGDMLTRLRLQQAFGRLIRSEKDRGVFVVLDGRMPQRLFSAFPEGAAIERVSLAEALIRTRDFLSEGEGEGGDA